MANHESKCTRPPPVHGKVSDRSVVESSSRFVSPAEKRKRPVLGEVMVAYSVTEAFSSYGFAY
jgi:hypothetical protein